MNSEDMEFKRMMEDEFDKYFSDLEDDLDDEVRTIILTDESGNELEFEFIDLIEYDREEYVVLLPVEGSEDSDEVLILRLDESGDQEAYESVEDESILASVFEIFKEKFKEEFNFID